MTRDAIEAFESISQIHGIQRILTRFLLFLSKRKKKKKQINFNSGHDKTALEGVYEILKLVELSQRKPNNNLIIVAGGGITERNIKRIVSESKVSEVFFFFFKFDIKLNFLISKNSHKVHLSGRSKIDSSMEYRNSNCSMGGMFGPSEYSLSFTNAQIIQKVHQQLQNK